MPLMPVRKIVMTSVTMIVKVMSQVKMIVENIAPAMNSRIYAGVWSSLISILLHAAVFASVLEDALTMVNQMVAASPISHVRMINP